LEEEGEETEQKEQHDASQHHVQSNLVPLHARTRQRIFLCN
jgi:hypothetical protein